MIYLDHAATTPVPAEVARSVYDTLFSGWGNPSSQSVKMRATLWALRAKQLPRRSAARRPS